MTNELNQQTKSVQQPFTEFFISTLPAFFLSFVLFIGGIGLLYLRIPKWSLFLGVPTIQLGIIFLILTFDKIIQSRTSPERLHIIPCSICNNPTPISLDKKGAICDICRQKMAKKLKTVKKNY
ncbi:hypothetical protein KKD62_00490 [Patescibacteria group bacterium]|nr:hypothetical protein [Patescibacteria group bacterium]MBU1931356.1 hypothetical protein [Patescibacteria group bacterium]